MTDTEKLAVLVAFLKKEAAENCWDIYDDDFCVNDFSGGNEDDAMYGGMQVGRVSCADAALLLIGEKV